MATIAGPYAAHRLNNSLDDRFMDVLSEGQKGKPDGSRAIRCLPFCPPPCHHNFLLVRPLRPLRPRRPRERWPTDPMFFLAVALEAVATSRTGVRRLRAALQGAALQGAALQGAVLQGAIQNSLARTYCPIGFRRRGRRRRTTRCRRCSRNNVGRCGWGRW